MSERTPRGKLGPLAALVLTLISLGQALHFWNVNTAALGRGLPIDDAYIFLRYAHNLAAGQGFAFNPGEISFGCTSLLWPLMLAGLQIILPSADPVALSFWLGAFLYHLAVIGVFVLLSMLYRRTWAAFAGAVMVAASPYLFMNAVSGMETPLTLLLLVVFAAVVTLDKKPRPLAAGIVAGLLTLNRPESLYFGPVAAGLWLVLSLLRRRPEWKPAAIMLAAWAALVLPAGLFIHAHTGSFLPTTYLGKIISGASDAFRRGLFERLFWSSLSLGDGWVKLILPLNALAPALAAGVVWRLGAAVKAARNPQAPLWPAFGWVLITGYLFLPGVYGFSFPVHPPFGGYYLRYIAPVQAAFIIVGLAGLVELGRFLAEKYALPEKRRWIAAVAAAAAMIAFQGWLWSFQFPAAIEVFRREVTLNTGLRKEAGLWLNGHVPPGERVMVGYTGLGVVGYYADRYCLDVGALINPDIFPYYRAAGRATDKRRRAILDYMRDRDARWYVSFFFAAEANPLVADPSTDPRFQEVTRLGREPAGPDGNYTQIRIFKVGWR